MSDCDAGSMGQLCDCHDALASASIEYRVMYTHPGVDEPVCHGTTFDPSTARSALNYLGGQDWPSIWVEQRSVTEWERRLVVRVSSEGAS